MRARALSYSLIVLLLRVALVVLLFGVGWLVYRKLPPSSSASNAQGTGPTALQIVLRSDQRFSGAALDVPVELYPIDIVAVRHEFFAERRAGERFDDFVKQRMKGRSP